MNLRAGPAYLRVTMFIALFLLGSCASGPDRLASISTFDMQAAGKTAYALANPQIANPAKPGKWRASTQTLFAGPVRDGTGSKFYFSGLQAKSVVVGISLVGANSAGLSLACDGPFTLTVPGDRVQESDGAEVHSGLAADDVGRTRATIEVSDGIGACTARFRFANSSRTIKLIREENLDSALLRLDTKYDVCSMPPAASLDPLEAVFYNHGSLSQTCPFPVGKPELLELENEAFNAKVKGLLGKSLSDEFIAKGDPGAPLDFSAAPDLQLIYLSTLDYKADFSGMVMSRLLRHHAAHGTRIRIQVSSVLERRKDARILEQLASDYPNVGLRKFAYSPKLSLSPDELLAGTHRVNHIKLFVALARDPAKSVAVIGGRNIHDGFLFEQPVNLDAYPQLHHYGPQHALTLNYYSNWHDFDIAMHDDRTARILASHYATIWFDDSDKFIARPYAGISPKAGRKMPGLARHFMSVPFSDGRALEDYYVSMIDAARENIEIVNPYLNPTKAVDTALDRAIKRGVKVEVVGRIDMSGDLGGEILTAVNQEFVEKNYKRMQISDYKAPNVLLHAKIMMIDRRLVSVSSVNLNNRSFLHDSENGIVVLDKDFYGRIRKVFDYYKADSRPVKDGAISLSLWRLLLWSRTLRQAL